jgi:hypothetical protein
VRRFLLAVESRIGYRLRVGGSWILHRFVWQRVRADLYWLRCRASCIDSVYRPTRVLVGGICWQDLLSLLWYRVVMQVLRLSDGGSRRGLRVVSTLIAHTCLKTGRRIGGSGCNR